MVIGNSPACLRSHDSIKKENIELENTGKARVIE